MKSSCSRWFGVHKGVVPCTSAAYIQRQSIVMVSGEYYVVICCFIGRGAWFSDRRSLSSVSFTFTSAAVSLQVLMV